FQSGVSIVGFADDVAVVVVQKDKEDVVSTTNVAIRMIGDWLRLAGLELAEHKTEAVLISSRKTAETVEITVGESAIASKRAIKYLGVMLDTRLTYKEHLQEKHKKARGVTAALSRMMLNHRGPKSSSRRLLFKVAKSTI
ncbi:hypothetical protein KR084_004736, partial [Drosophila pseudotakahashii]